MQFLQTIILGIVQGATEFIPVSSSGHLVLVREFLGWEDPGLSFDITLHFATVVAIIFYFLKKRSIFLKRRLLLGIAIATLPAVLLGYFLADWVDQYLRSAFSVGALMIGVGIFFLYIEKHPQKPRAGEALSFKSYFWIGLAQAIALLPGISRSGMTISVGMSQKLSRSAAAEFSFLLAIPIILGATSSVACSGAFIPSIVVSSLFRSSIGQVSGGRSNHDSISSDHILQIGLKISISSG